MEGNNPRSFQLSFKILFPRGETLLIQANCDDTIKSVHEQILVNTRIPVTRQELIFLGKPLHWQKNLAECSITYNTCLHLALRSSLCNGISSERLPHPSQVSGQLGVWDVIDKIVSTICRLCEGEIILNPHQEINFWITQFFNFWDTEWMHLLIQYSVPATLVMLYASPYPGNRECAAISINHFLAWISKSQKWLDAGECATLMLELCKLLRTFSHEYDLCRNSLLQLLIDFSITNGRRFKYGEDVTKEILPFVSELATKLGNDLFSATGPSSWDVGLFTSFLVFLCHDIEMKLLFHNKNYVNEMRSLRLIFDNLLTGLVYRLKQAFDPFPFNKFGQCYWSQFLPILGALNSISKLLEGARVQFWKELLIVKDSLGELIVSQVMQTNDHLWLLEHKHVTNRKSKRHLARMLFPGDTIPYEKVHSRLLFWSELLDDDLFIQIKNVAPTYYPGVMHGWLPLFCTAIFNPKIFHFKACPKNPFTFYPDPASKLEPLHFECFKFTGFLIASALMLKAQVSIALHPVFLLQLSGKNISLEDVKDLAPDLYSICKEIMEMDAKLSPDGGANGHETNREVYFNNLKFKFKKALELCSDGESVIIDSKNGKEFVDNLIQYFFVKSISKQVSFFAQGFAEVLGCSTLLETFFGNVEPEDINEMLHGFTIFGPNPKICEHNNKGCDSLILRFNEISRRKRNFQNWQKSTEDLGKGSFATVYRGLATSGFFFAVKQFSLQGEESERKLLIDKVEREIALLSQLNHENIVQYYGTDSDESNLYIFLELVSNGSLEKVYKTFPLEDSQVSAYTKQILHGLNYLHERNVVHSDIKCANILIDTNGRVKVADFGLSKVSEHSDLIRSSQGINYWMAPEVANKKKGGYGVKADIWSLGCTVLEMLTGKLPQHVSNLRPDPIAIQRGILRGDGPFIPTTLSAVSREFISKCLNMDPNARPTAVQLLEDPFVKDADLHVTSPILNPPY